MNNVIALIVAAFKKWGLGLLFILLGITWILINPIIRLGIVGADYFKEYGGTPWSYVTGAHWVVSLICLGVGVLLFLRKFKPSVKIPEYVYTLAFGAIALFSLVDFINVLAEISFIPADQWQYAPSFITTHYTMSIISSIVNTLAFASVVAVMLNKKKFARFWYAPAIVHVLGVLFLAIGNLVLVNSEYVSRINQCDYVTSIIFGVLFTLAIMFFCLFFAVNAQAQEAVAELVEDTEANEEVDLNSVESVTAATAAPEPQLTDAQKEELANVKELYELGAYTEEEYEAEKQRIIYNL